MAPPRIFGGGQARGAAAATGRPSGASSSSTTPSSTSGRCRTWAASAPIRGTTGTRTPSGFLTSLSPSRGRATLQTRSLGEFCRARRYRGQLFLFAFFCTLGNFFALYCAAMAAADDKNALLSFGVALVQANKNNGKRDGLFLGLYGYTYARGTKGEEHRGRVEIFVSPETKPASADSFGARGRRVRTPRRRRRRASFHARRDGGADARRSEIAAPRDRERSRRNRGWRRRRRERVAAPPRGATWIF